MRHVLAFINFLTFSVPIRNLRDEVAPATFAALGLVVVAVAGAICALRLLTRAGGNVDRKEVTPCLRVGKIQVKCAEMRSGCESSVI